MGFGHLVRALSLAEALGVAPVVSVRGGRVARAAAHRLGALVLPGGPAAAVLDAARPSVLVVDDRVASATAAWRARARALGVPIVSIHDLGLGLGDADLIVDGSIAVRPTLRPEVPALLGPDFAILNARCVSAPRGRRGRPGPLVVIALGGGSRRVVALRLACAIARRQPRAAIRIAGGFVPAPSAHRPRRVTRVAPSRLGVALSTADVAVVAGGITLYEACALGVPAVAVAIVPSQCPTVTAFAARGAAVDGGLLRPGGPDAAEALRRVGDQVARLLDDSVGRRRLARAAKAAVDGQGAARVARAVARLLDRVACREEAR
jgi:spore coat polysaccharide biosynthesis predicted glycosyltransferase SpsG